MLLAFWSNWAKTIVLPSGETVIPANPEELNLSVSAISLTRSVEGS